MSLGRGLYGGTFELMIAGIKQVPDQEVATPKFNQLF